MKRVALCIGVNDYADPGITPLRYAEADATELYAFLKHSADYDRVRLFTAPESDLVLDAARDLAVSLEPGDLFVFFFAGHGYEFQGRHLLLCPKARLSRLEFFQQTVPVDLLKRETQQLGVDRVFMLDACRSNLLRERSGPTGLCGAQSLRDIVMAPMTEAGGAFTLLCGCDEGQQAGEIPALGQGLFSRALLEELEAAVKGRSELRLDDRWETQLRSRMDRLANRFNLPANQRPWIWRSGDVPVLVAGQVEVALPPPPLPPPPSPPPPEPSPPRPARVKCPACGRRNLEDETFECRLCKRDHLCEAHWTESDRCCADCAERLARERAEAERQAREAAARAQPPSPPPPSPTNPLPHAAPVALAAPPDQPPPAPPAATPPSLAGAGAIRAESSPAPLPKLVRAEVKVGPQDPCPCGSGKAHRHCCGRQVRPLVIPDTAWTNSMGMPFVPVPGTAVWCCLWPARVQDYEAFTIATQRAWTKPAFEQEPTHPAVNVRWDDAQAFCQWLTEQERAANLLTPDRSYRLPTDEEWSRAVGLANEPGKTPRDRSGKIRDWYPWGSPWPPPDGAGNYRDETCHRFYPEGSFIAGYDDGYVHTSPVGSFAPNALGLYDLGGNVWEWCEDWYDEKREARALRGASWGDGLSGYLLASRRLGDPISYRDVYIGFRVVLTAQTLGEAGVRGEGFPPSTGKSA